MLKYHETEYVEWRVALKKKGEEKFAEASEEALEQDYFHEIIVNHLNFN